MGGKFVATIIVNIVYMAVILVKAEHNLQALRRWKMFL